MINTSGCQIISESVECKLLFASITIKVSIMLSHPTEGDASGHIKCKCGEKQMICIDACPWYCSPSQSIPRVDICDLSRRLRHTIDKNGLSAKNIET